MTGKRFDGSINVDIRDSVPDCAEASIEEARTRGWTVVSVKDDWATVFADPQR